MDFCPYRPALVCVCVLSKTTHTTPYCHIKRTVVRELCSTMWCVSEVKCIKNWNAANMKVCERPSTDLLVVVVLWALVTLLTRHAGAFRTQPLKQKQQPKKEESSTWTQLQTNSLFSPPPRTNTSVLLRSVTIWGLHTHGRHTHTRTRTHTQRQTETVSQELSTVPHVQREVLEVTGMCY